MRFFILLFLVGVFFVADHICHPKGTKFRSLKVVTYHHSPEWELPAPSKEEQQELDRILSQKFTYFARGGQTYVFLSEDGKHVVKFLKQQKISPRTWLAYLPFPPFRQQYLSFQDKRRRTFHALKIAYTEFKEETGLLYVHLNRTHDLKKTALFYDKRGKKHPIDMDKASFSIQRKADLLYPYISELVQQNNPEKAKEVMTSFYSLVDYFARKGVVDHDPILRKNFGVLDGKVIQFDIGYLRIDPLQATQDRAASMRNKFDKWIANNHPQLQDK